MPKDSARRMLWRPLLSAEQFERLESTRDPNLPGVLATREVLVEGHGVSAAAERHDLRRQAIHKRIQGIIGRAAAAGESVPVRVQCVGHDPLAFAEALDCPREAITWHPPGALADAIGLMRAYADDCALVWPDLCSTLSLLPGAGQHAAELAEFFGNDEALYRARCGELLATYGARTGLADIVLEIPAQRYGELEALARETPLAPECPEAIEHNPLWELTARLPYARSRATQRELFELFHNPSRGRPSEGATPITRRVFSELGVGEMVRASPGVARAPEGVAAFARMLVQEHAARINRETYMRPVYTRESLARALRQCRGELGPRLRTRAGRWALRRVYLEGVPPNSAFPGAGFTSVPARDIVQLRSSLKGEPAHVLLHYLAAEQDKPALEAAFREIGVEPLEVEVRSVAGSRRVCTDAVMSITRQRRGPRSRIEPLLPEVEGAAPPAVG